MKKGTIEKSKNYRKLFERFRALAFRNDELKSIFSDLIEVALGKSLDELAMTEEFSTPESVRKFIDKMMTLAYEGLGKELGK